MTGFQVSAPQGADAYAHQFLYAESQAGEHLAHLALQSLFQHDACAAGGETGNILGFGLPLGNAHPLEQLNKHAAVECLVERDPVFLFDSTAGVCQILAHAAVVGENEQTFAICIQTSHIVGVAIFCRQKVVHGANGTLRIAAAYIATRLVEQDDDFLLRDGSSSIHLHKISGHDAQTRGVHGFAVYFYTPLCNEAVCGSAAFVTAHGQKFIEAYAALRGCGVAVVFSHGQIFNTSADKGSPAVATTGGLQKM